MRLGLLKATFILTMVAVFTAAGSMTTSKLANAGPRRHVIPLIIGAGAAAAILHSQNKKSYRKTRRSKKKRAPSISRRQVTDIQAALNDAGYDAGPEDGVAGSRTRDAVSQFQYDFGYTATGRLTGKEKEHLFSVALGEDPASATNEDAAQPAMDDSTSASMSPDTEEESAAPIAPGTEEESAAPIAPATDTQSAATSDGAINADVLAYMEQAYPDLASSNFQDVKVETIFLQDQEEGSSASDFLVVINDPPYCEGEKCAHDVLLRQPDGALVSVANFIAVPNLTVAASSTNGLRDFSSSDGVSTVLWKHDGENYAPSAGAVAATETPPQ